MACRYYDDLIVAKIKRWIPESSQLRVLKPSESKRLFQLTADDNKDAALKLPLIALSRNNDIELLSTIKNSMSFDGLHLRGNEKATAQLNVIPIKLEYQLDIYTKRYEECDEYVRELLFKLINNPLLMIDIPYNSKSYDQVVTHTANIRVLNTVSDTSDISERVFSGQFTKFTIQLEIQDAFLFSIPYRTNWRLHITDDELVPEDEMSALEVSEKIELDGEQEPIEAQLVKAE